MVLHWQAEATDPSWQFIANVYATVGEVTLACVICCLATWRPLYLRIVASLHSIHIRCTESRAHRLESESSVIHARADDRVCESVSLRMEDTIDYRPAVQNVRIGDGRHNKPMLCAVDDLPGTEITPRNSINKFNV